MDFTLDETQTELVGLADRILGEQAGPDQLRALEVDGDDLAEAAWSAWASADLVGLCLPTADGGGGYGMVEAALLAESVGRHAAPVPYIASVVRAAMPVAVFGTPAQRTELLPGVVEADTHLAAALTEAGDGIATTEPATVAASAGDGWELFGTKTFVAGLARASTVLVPARTPERGTVVFCVPTDAEGLDIRLDTTTDRNQVGTLTLDGVRVGGDDRLGGPEGADGSEVVTWIDQRSRAAGAAQQAGTCEAALGLAASYTSQRRQFDNPLATFQAVAHRLADAYVDTEAIRLTSRQAAWRLDAGVDAAEAVAVASWWAAEGGHRVTHAAQHVHGGIGVDTDYPLHRYFRAARAATSAAGGGTRQLIALGDRLADQVDRHP